MTKKAIYGATGERCGLTLFPSLVLALLFLAAPSFLAAQAAPDAPLRAARSPLVVAAFKDLSGGTEKLGEAVALSITASLADCANIRPLERAELDAILAEMELGMSGLVDEATAAQAGRLIGAKFMVFGAVALVAGTCQVTWRVVSVETGEQLAAGKTRGAKADLLDMADRVALDLDKAVGAIKAKSK